MTLVFRSTPPSFHLVAMAPLLSPISRTSAVTKARQSPWGQLTMELCSWREPSQGSRSSRSSDEEGPARTDLHRRLDLRILRPTRQSQDSGFFPLAKSMSSSAPSGELALEEQESWPWRSQESWPWRQIGFSVVPTRWRRPAGAPARMVHTNKENIHLPHVRAG